MVTKSTKKKSTRKAAKKAGSKKSTRSEGAGKRPKSKSSPGIISRVKKVAGKILVGAASGAAKGAMVGAVEAGSEATGNGQAVGGEPKVKSSTKKDR